MIGMLIGTVLAVMLGYIYPEKFITWFDSIIRVEIIVLVILLIVILLGGF